MGTSLRAAGALMLCCGLITSANATPSLRMRESFESAPSPKAPPQRLAAATALPPPPPVPGVEPAPSPGLAPWAWYAIAGACVVGGLVVDFGFESSSNGNWDAMDFVPLALYGAGVGIVIKERF